MIDTHAHLNFKDFNEDREEVISRAFQSGIKRIINVGTDVKESRSSVKIAEKYKDIFAAVGLHPQYFSSAKKFPIFNFQFSNFKFKKDIEKIKKLAENKKVVAIGEIGLDYFRISRNAKYEEQEFKKIKKLQEKGLSKQLKLAQELNLPVITHCRASEENPEDAYDDLYVILTRLGGEESRNNIAGVSKTGSRNKFGMTKIVFHCYGGNLEFTKKLLKHKNIYFSFTGNITYKIKKEAEGTEKDIIEIIKIIPPERIMLETDCPFLAPQKFRGKRNEPAFVKYTAEKLAEIKKVNFKKINKITTQNAEKFFGLC